MYANLTKALQSQNNDSYGLSSEQYSKIETYLLKNYGFKVAQQIKEECKKPKDLYKTIILRELSSIYKYPDAAYAALDFKGKGYVDVNDFIQSKIVYRLPFNQQELREFLENDTIFKKQPKLKIDMFSRYFYANKTKDQNTNFDFDDSDQEEQIGNNKKDIDLTTIENSSLMSTSRNRDIQNSIKLIDQILKERLSNNWVSVRKAFLDIDEDYDGFLTAEDFAKLIGGSSGSSRFDFNLIKMLINMRSKTNNSKINYTEFCQWFGCVIEPVEAFYFRHDSQKNPQYEKNMQKSKKIREMISNQDLKGKFIQKLHNQYKTTQKAFTDMSKSKEGYISSTELYQIVKGWGFEVTEDSFKELFNWLDADKDDKISYEDLRATAGKEISPMEQLFFRQDVKQSKSTNCKYEKCWENNNFNEKSQYCLLHQKVLRNQCLDKFSQIAKQVEQSKWEEIVQEICKANYQMSIGQLNEMLMRVTGKKLRGSEKEAICETFKVKQNIEENMDNIEERVVNLQAFINARRQSRLKKIKDLISQEEEDEQIAEDIKLQGLIQVNEDFIKEIAYKKKSQWGGIWKSIKRIDRDSNGYVTIEELQELFKEYFPVELEGKSLAKFFKKYISIQNKQLVNYKQIKENINQYILTSDKNDKYLKNHSFIEISKSKLAHQTIEENIDKKDILVPLQSHRVNTQSDIEQNLITKATLANLINRSITPLRVNNQESYNLPQQNLGQRNTSIQKLNNITVNESEIQQRNITPVMKRAYQKSLTRNVSGIKTQINQSQNSTLRTFRINEDLKSKLAYEWKNIFRAISQTDHGNKGQVDITSFNNICHQQKVCLTKEDLKKIEKQFGISHHQGEVLIDYLKISQDLGLHKSVFDQMRNNSSKILYQITRFKEQGKKSPRFDNEIINQTSKSLKMKNALTCLQSMDKQKQGLTSVENFMKVLRIFGIQFQFESIQQSKNGMINYEKELVNI